MMFQSWLFLPFFLIFFLVYLVLQKTRLRNLWLLISSYVFYGWWNPLFLILIGYATVVDYFLAWLMEKGEKRKLWLSLSIINDLGLLAFFKYAGFMTENINALLDRLGSSVSLDTPSILLPVGISFYIFKSVAYMIDCYRGTVAREKNFINYAAFVSFFPLLVAGPIERAANLLGQLRLRKAAASQDLADGLSLFVVGLFKKVAIADLLSIYVDKVYGVPSEYQAPALMLATFAFAWQIYFDFSGYSDMARGIAQMCGFKIMLNFNHPYLATGLRDFWARWHISLSTWFKDYLYIPLGGNRKGRFNTYKNMFITIVVSGFWHGAAWTFVIWGALHGFGMGLTREMERSKFYQDKIPKFAKQMFTFVFVCFAWIFFRASTWDDARLIVGRIFTSGLADPKFPLYFLPLILSVWLYQFMYESRLQALLKVSVVRVGLVIFMILYLSIFVSSGVQAFIYNQF